MSLLIALVYAIGSVICHQRPDRSFFVDGHQLPVCARCSGLYVSGAIGFAAWFVAKAVRGWRCASVDPRIALRTIVIAAVLTVLSLAAAAIDVWDGSNVTRAILVLPLGACAGVIVAAVATKDLR